MKDERDDRDRKENGANGDERKGTVNPFLHIRMSTGTNWLTHGQLKVLSPPMTI